jgi:hypothetical protein
MTRAISANAISGFVRPIPRSDLRQVFANPSTCAISICLNLGVLDNPDWNANPRATSN